MLKCVRICFFLQLKIFSPPVRRCGKLARRTCTRHGQLHVGAAGSRTGAGTGPGAEAEARGGAGPGAGLGAGPGAGLGAGHGAGLGAGLRAGSGTSEGTCVRTRTKVQLACGGHCGGGQWRTPAGSHAGMSWLRRNGESRTADAHMRSCGSRTNRHLTSARASADTGRRDVIVPDSFGKSNMPARTAASLPCMCACMRACVSVQAQTWDEHASFRISARTKQATRISRRRTWRSL